MLSARLTCLDSRTGEHDLVSTTCVRAAGWRRSGQDGVRNGHPGRVHSVWRITPLVDGCDDRAESARSGRNAPRAKERDG